MSPDRPAPIEHHCQRAPAVRILGLGQSHSPFQVWYRSRFLAQFIEHPADNVPNIDLLQRMILESIHSFGRAF